MSTDRWWQPGLKTVIEGRKVVLIGVTAPGLAPIAKSLLEAGATEVMIRAMTKGGGNVPGVTVIDTDPPDARTMPELTRFWSEQVTNPDAVVRAALDTFDPDRTALVIRMLPIEELEFAGRPILSMRQPSWVALEDKTVIDGFLDRHQIGRKPSAVVSLDEAAETAGQFDEGHGTVWAGDARSGINSGAQLTRRVVTERDAQEVTSDFAPLCDFVRVMPFVDGIPCSIHGFVLEDGNAVLRPVEMLTLDTGSRFVFVGVATFWDPPTALRDLMAETATKVCAALRSEADYRGAFSLDGVADHNGFWPTEINPRISGGLLAIAEQPGAPPLTLLNELIVARLPIGVSAKTFEDKLVTHTELHRTGLFGLFEPSTAACVNKPVSFDGSTWSWTTTANDPIAGRINAGPFGVRVNLTPAAQAAGPSAGPLAAAFVEFANRELGVNVSLGTPASDTTDSWAHDPDGGAP